MITTYLQKLRLLSRDVRLFLVSGALLSFAYFGFYGVLFNLYLLRLGFDAELIGLVQGVSSLPMIILSLPAGELGRRWGVRRTTIAGTILLSLGALLPPLAELLPPSLWVGWLMVTYALSGAGAALYIVNSNPLLMSATSPEQRNHAFSLQSALSPVMAFAGNLISGLLPGVLATALGVTLDDPAPYRYPLLIAGVLSIPAVLPLLAVREGEGDQPGESRGEASPAPWGLIALLASFALLRAVGGAATNTFFNVYMDEDLQAPTSLIGALAASSRLVPFVAALIGPLLVGRWGRFRTIALGAVGVAVSILPIVFVRHWAAAGLSLMGVSSMTLMTYPAFTVYYQEIVAPDRRGTASGAVATAEALSSPAMIMAGGYVITALGYRTLFLLGAGVTGLRALLFWTSFRVPRGELSRTKVMADTH